MNRYEQEAIIETLGRPELLTQLAEEAAELAQAALKLRRAITGDNPTPVTAAQAVDNLLEEWGDTALCMAAIGFDPTACDDDRMNAKRARWAQRIQEHRAKAQGDRL